MVNVRNVFAFTTMALVAAVSASYEDEHRTLQAVNFRTDLLDAINAARKKEGLDALCINEKLMDAAQIQANDMADNNFIKSTGSDGSVPKTRAADQGFKAETVTEIVGAGYRTAESIVAAWSKASSAKKTIFSKANVMGPGYTFDKTRKYVHFWAVDFSTGECGDGIASTSPGGSGDTSGSVELPKSNDASGSVEAPSSDSGSGPAPAPAPASGSGDETPAVTPAPAGSGSETPAGTPAPAPAGSGSETPAGTPAPAAAPADSGSETPAGTPAPAAAPAATPAPAASGSDDDTQETPAPAGSTPETPAGPGEDAPAATPAPAATDAPDTPSQ